ncbi:tetratricopeptide repeat protein [Persephonella sp.]
MKEDVNSKLANRILITNIELVGLFVTVLVILFLLFPRDKLLKYTKPENYNLLSKENIFLSIKYLEEITKKHPEYYDLKLLLIHKYIQTGNINRATVLLREYINQRGYDPSVLILEYQLLKYDAFSFPEGSTERKTKLEKLRKFIEKNFEHFKDSMYLEYFYKESIFLNAPHLALKIAERLSNIDREREKYWLEKVIKLSLALKDYEKTLSTYRKLSLIEPHRYLYWIKKIVEVELSIGRYAEALKHYQILIRSEKDIDKKIRYIEKAGQISIWIKNYKRAAQFYIDAMKISRTEKEKIRYFIKALRTLQSGNRLKEATGLIRRYGFEFIKKDKKAGKLMLKIALAANDHELAREISLALLREIK